MSYVVHEGKTQKITTKTRYGSHSEMIVKDLEAPEGKVFLKDDVGVYLTDRKRIDNGLADPNRYSGR